MGFDFTVIAPLLPSHCGFSFVFGCGVSFVVSSSVFLLMIVQQLVVIMVFSQEGVRACPSTPPSWFLLVNRFLNRSLFFLEFLGNLFFFCNVFFIISCFSLGWTLCPLPMNLPKCEVCFFLYNYFYFILFIYLFWLHWVFVAVCRPSLVAASGSTLRCSALASHFGGFSCCRARALECRLSRCGSWA